MNEWFSISYDIHNQGKEIVTKYKSLNDFEQETPFGFVYCITNLTNDKIYIGKKQIMNKTNVKLGKKEIKALPISRGRKKRKKQVIKESNWQTYWGSNPELLNDIKELGYDNFEREIIKICRTKKELTYWETAYQFKEGVLLTNNYNSNILGKFFRTDF